MKTFFTLILLIFNYLTVVGQYNYYFGNIHAHSTYSDGNSEPNGFTPLQNYNYADASLHFDFLGISDHNHAGAGMSLPNYALGLNDAILGTINGSFVALYGMEWGTISNGGHVVIYGYNQLIGWEPGNYDVYNAVNNYNGLFAKVAATPGAFAYLAHPAIGDYNDLLTLPLASYPYNSVNDQAIVGMALRSGPAFSTNTTYSNPSSSSFLARYKEALAKGYHLGAGLDHDNHYTTFGRTAQSRMVVLANNLTQADIMDGIRNMRTYASDDWNCKVAFTINTGNWMGSIVSNPGNPTLQVNITDDDAEPISSIDIYYGVPGSGIISTLLHSALSTTTLTYTHSIANLSEYYYYVIIEQADGDRIVTSPIWYRRDDTVLPITWENWQATTTDNHHILLNWKPTAAAAAVLKSAPAMLQESSDGLTFQDVMPLRLQEDEFSFLEDKHITGNRFYRLEIHWDGQLYYSPVLSVFRESNTLILNGLYPNPATDEIFLNLFSPQSENVELRIFSTTGMLVHQQTLSLSPNNSLHTVKIDHLSPGQVYYLQLIGSQQSITQKFIKQ
jgi:hypothetical protein